MAIHFNQWRGQVNKQTAVAIFLLILGCFEMCSAATPPCWKLRSSVYNNGKCFALSIGRLTFDEAQKQCASINQRLAEPRTQRSGDLLMHNGNFNTVDAYIGAQGKVVTEARFESDRSLFELQNIRDPKDSPCDKEICCVTTHSTGLWMDVACENRFNFICEKDVPEVYVLPILPNTRDGSFRGVLEMIAKPIKMKVTVEIFLYTSTEYSSLKVIVLSETEVVGAYLLNIKTDSDTSSIQKNCLIIKASHPVSLTFKATALNYDDIMFLMVPYVTEFLDVKPRYLIVSPSDVDIVDQVIIISLSSTNVTEVTLDFWSVRPDYVVTVDNLRIKNPRSIEASLNTSESVVIQGDINMEALRITATEEVAVYVTITVNSTMLALTKVLHHVTQEGVMSSNYVTFPSNVTNGTDVYKLVSLFGKTNITFNGTYRYLEYSRQIEMVSLPSNQYFYVEGNRPFKMFKVYSKSRNDLCSVPLVPEEMWRKDYKLVFTDIDWMMVSKNASLHLITDKDGEKRFTLNGEEISPTCFDVEGHANMSGCVFNIIDYKQLSATFPVFLYFEMPEVFGAYLSWRVNGQYSCKVLGYKLVDVVLESWIEGIYVGATSAVTVSTTAEISSESTERYFSSPIPKNITNTTETPNDSTPTTTESGENNNNSTNQNTFTISSVPDAMITSETTSSRTSSILSSATLRPGLTVPTQTTPKNNTDFTNTTLNETLACSPPKTLPTNLTVKELGELLTTIKKKLAVNTRETSSYVRKKTSAKDRRPSSQSMGYVGIIAIVISLGIFVIADVVTCTKYLLQLFKRAIFIYTEYTSNK